MKPVKSMLLVAACLLDPGLVSAQVWTQTSAPTKNWYSVACCADGSKLVAVAYGGGIYTSTNYGSTWTSNTVPQGLNWLSVASSADGTLLAAVPFNATPYTSANSGATWNDHTPFANDWHCVASSADGQRLLGAGNFGGIATSTNAGSTWTRATNTPADWWGCLASSADGSKLVAMVADATSAGGIYTSADFGATWTTNKTLARNWTSVAASADGSKLAAVWGGSSVFLSTNSGGSWSSYNIISQDFASIASSADGVKLVAASTSLAPGALFTSADSGMTWSSNRLSQSGNWKSVASSADGNRLVAVANGGGIWTLQRTPKPQLGIASAAGDTRLSWIVPSTNFALQQSADLTSWTDVTNPPTLNVTNLQDEVALLPTNGCGFFRLKTP